MKAVVDEEPEREVFENQVFAGGNNKPSAPPPAYAEKKAPPKVGKKTSKERAKEITKNMTPEQLFYTPGHIESVIEKLAEVREKAVLADEGNLFDGEQETADSFSKELGYKDWTELVDNLKRRAEETSDGLVLIAPVVPGCEACLVLKAKSIKFNFIAIEIDGNFCDHTDEAESLFSYDSLTHQFVGDLDNPKILIAYLRLLKERQLVFPDDCGSIAQQLDISIEVLGVEGPPGIFAIVDEIVTKVGKGQRVLTFDVLIWNVEANGMIEETDARFYDSQSEHAGEDWVWFWDEETCGWINKKKSEDVESDSESEESAKSDSESDDVESDSEEARDFSYKGA